ncbi:hypothetical protein AUEXF2481DRAFT_700569 [Aureobasidium subglaciale EXF-2481]|uniref:Uncharacterized protein n=1 Tax=Aureobasidium subglaciale (strain EXF-2481) TaxID=1043005 RepID=A0A074Y3Y7_AURSE|nr:uncharacterized protein AUEXF2481DRAFT_700569 [Aureobasidium subglaciale EXF-2481]KEQ92440.1 hypothetical protein AUEXF2481DRAFT_700569 [Aureobasidium subglaciale EXF-2481]
MNQSAIFSEPIMLMSVSHVIAEFIPPGKRRPISHLNQLAITNFCKPFINLPLSFDCESIRIVFFLTDGIQEINRVLSETYTHAHAQSTPNFVIIDSLETIYAKATATYPGTAGLNTPFLDTSPEELVKILRTLCAQGSDVNFTQFILLNHETEGKDWVYLYHSGDAEIEEENVTARGTKVGLEVVEETMMLVDSAHPGFEAIEKDTQDCEGGVYDRWKEGVNDGGTRIQEAFL